MLIRRKKEITVVSAVSTLFPRDVQGFTTTPYPRSLSFGSRLPLTLVGSRWLPSGDLFRHSCLRHSPRRLLAVPTWGELPKGEYGTPPEVTHLLPSVPPYLSGEKTPLGLQSENLDSQLESSLRGQLGTQLSYPSPPLTHKYGERTREW